MSLQIFRPHFCIILRINNLSDFPGEAGIIFPQPLILIMSFLMCLIFSRWGNISVICPSTETPVSREICLVKKTRLRKKNEGRFRCVLSTLSTGLQLWGAGEHYYSITENMKPQMILARDFSCLCLYVFYIGSVFSEGESGV